MMSEPAAPTTVRSNEVIRLADLTVISDTIRSIRFENCMILGPAVVFLVGSALNECSFDAPGPEAIIWDIALDRRTEMVGAIAVEGCEFQECRFQNVGFAVDEDGANALRATPQNQDRP